MKRDGRAFLTVAYSSDQGFWRLVINLVVQLANKFVNHQQFGDQIHERKIDIFLVRSFARGGGGGGGTLNTE